MSGGFLTSYAQAIPPEARVDAFVTSERRLTWISLLFSDFPNADIYLVGGALRDILLGGLPHDIDLVVRNIEIADLQRWLTRHGACELIEKRFGTLKFVPHGMGGTLPLDITLPRKEWISSGHTSGRRDLETASDPRLPIKDDLARRDFTINAMAFDLRRARLVDPYGGLSDLHCGLVRAVLSPQARFYEDATRMLRGLRFASQLRFGIEARTWEALKENLHLIDNNILTEEGTHRYIVARESIGREFLLGLAAHPSHTLDLWEASGALERFLPDVAAMSRVVERDGETALKKTRRVLELLKRPSLLAEHGRRNVPGAVLVAALMAFAEDDKAKRAYHICKRLYFHQFPTGHGARVDCEHVLWLLEHLHDFEREDPATMRPSHFERLYCSSRGQDLLLLAHAIAIASGRHTPARERLQTARRLSRQICENAPPELVSGNDISSLGIEPGPIYRTLLDEVRDAQLIGNIQTKEEALTLLANHTTSE